MAGLTIEVKCKDIDAYKLGGVQKIEFERHTASGMAGDEVNFDYIATTIFDTRKYAYENVEYIKVHGGSPEVDEEFRFILEFAESQDFFIGINCRQLRALWTAYCFHHNLECDTSQYDRSLSEVWNRLQKNKHKPCFDWVDSEEEGTSGFDLFDIFMCADLT